MLLALILPYILECFYLNEHVFSITYFPQHRSKRALLHNVTIVWYISRYVLQRVPTRWCFRLA